MGVHENYFKIDAEILFKAAKSAAIGLNYQVIYEDSEEKILSLVTGAGFATFAGNKLDLQVSESGKNSKLTINTSINRNGGFLASGQVYDNGAGNRAVAKLLGQIQNVLI